MLKVTPDESHAIFCLNRRYRLLWTGYSTVNNFQLLGISVQITVIFFARQREKKNSKEDGPKNDIVGKDLHEKR